MKTTKSPTVMTEYQRRGFRVKKLVETNTGYKAFEIFPTKQHVAGIYCQNMNDGNDTTITIPTFTGCDATDVELICKAANLARQAALEMNTGMKLTVLD